MVIIVSDVCRVLIGSLSNYYYDDDDNFMKKYPLMVKTTTLHVHHAF